MSDLVTAPTDDEVWLTHLYVFLGLECDCCGAQLECESCWDGLSPDESAAEMFAERATALARMSGWRLARTPHDELFYCPECSRGDEVGT